MRSSDREARIARLLSLLPLESPEQARHDMEDDPTFIPLGKIPDPTYVASDETKASWLRGDCRCVCDATRGGDGKIESTGACQCQRLVGLREDIGGPKAVHEPCTPTKGKTDMKTKQLRSDATDVATTVQARARRDRAAANAWRGDSVGPSRLRQSFNDAVTAGELDDEELERFHADVQRAIVHRAERRGMRTGTRTDADSTDGAILRKRDHVLYLLRTLDLTVTELDAITKMLEPAIARKAERTPASPPERTRTDATETLGTLFSDMQRKRDVEDAHRDFERRQRSASAAPEPGTARQKMLDRARDAWKQ